MPQIDYYFAPISPFCYLAGNRLEAIAKGANAKARSCAEAHIKAGRQRLLTLADEKI